MLETTNIEQKSDEELAQLILLDKDYFLYLARRYEAKLLRYIIRISGVAHEEAEDILQDVFIKVYKNINNFDPDLKFSSWIYRITRNETISHHRKKESKLDKMKVDIEDNYLENISSDLNLEKEVDLQYLKERIEKALSKLEPKYSEVLILKFIEEKDYREISDILQKPMGTVATLINRAKGKLKEELEKI